MGVGIKLSTQEPLHPFAMFLHQIGRFAPFPAPPPRTGVIVGLLEALAAATTPAPGWPDGASRYGLLCWPVRPFGLHLEYFIVEFVRQGPTVRVAHLEEVAAGIGQRLDAAHRRYLN
jgi:hypothetical protein